MQNEMNPSHQVTRSFVLNRLINYANCFRLKHGEVLKPSAAHLYLIFPRLRKHEFETCELRTVAAS